MKDSSLSAQLEPIIKPVAKFLWRFHVMLYSFIVIGGVAVVIVLFIGLLSTSPDQSQTTETIFDKKTIKSIENFEPASSSIDSFSLPAGRSHPFAE